MCLPQHSSVGLSIYLSIYIFWAFISLQDLLRPFSNPCILSIMPHVFANTNFAYIHFHSKIHLGQSLHTRKCNRKHRIEWNILQTPQHCKSEIRNDNRAEMFDEFMFHDDDKNRAFVYCWLDDDDDNDDDDYDNDSCLCSHFDHSIAVYIFFCSFCLINNTCIILVFYVLCDSNAIATVVLVHVFCYPFVFIPKFPSHLVDVIGKQSSFRCWNVWIMNIT